MQKRDVSNQVNSMKRWLYLRISRLAKYLLVTCGMLVLSCAGGCCSTNDNWKGYWEDFDRQVGRSDAVFLCDANIYENKIRLVVKGVWRRSSDILKEYEVGSTLDLAVLDPLLTIHDEDNETIVSNKWQMYVFMTDIWSIADPNGVVVRNQREPKWGVAMWNCGDGVYGPDVNMAVERLRSKLHVGSRQKELRL